MENIHIGHNAEFYKNLPNLYSCHMVELTLFDILWLILQLSRQRINLFLSWRLSRGARMINYCTVLVSHKPLNSWNYYSKGPPWIIFRHLTVTWSNTPSPHSLSCFLFNTVLFSILTAHNTVVIVILHQVAPAHWHGLKKQTNSYKKEKSTTISYTKHLHARLMVVTYVELCGLKVAFLASSLPQRQPDVYTKRTFLVAFLIVVKLRMYAQLTLIFLICFRLVSLGMFY